MAPSEEQGGPAVVLFLTTAQPPHGRRSEDSQSEALARVTKKCCHNLGRE